MLSRIYKQQRRGRGQIKEGVPEVVLNADVKGQVATEAQRCQGDLGDRKHGDRARAGRAGP